MDFSITPKSALEKVAAALIELAKGVEPESRAENPATAANAPAETAHADAAAALVLGGFVERILGETRTGVTAAPAQPPGERVDKGVESANMQTFARPHAPVSEPLRPAETALPTDQHAKSEFAVPASLLVPATLTGLQAEHAALWPMPARGFGTDPAPLHDARVHGHAEALPPGAQEPEEHEQEAAPEQDPSEEESGASGGAVLEGPDVGSWCDELTRALRLALAAAIAPRALRVADEQWRRGRCVVLACPQGADPAGPAWAFVLWPRRRTEERWRRAANLPPQPLVLFGLRVEARLQWSATPVGVRWRHGRMIKEHHPRNGRQLVAIEVAATAAEPAAVPCEVQLGPVLARRPRQADVCVRIAAAQRFWAALGRQWSVHVAVCSQPLAAPPVQPSETSSC